MESDAFPAPFSGHGGARQVFKVYVTAFPDLHLDIEQILAAGDSHVLVRWRSRGTHLGPLGDIPATGRKASNHGCTIIEVKNNKVAHAWVYFDNAHLLRQIGVLPGVDASDQTDPQPGRGNFGAFGRRGDLDGAGGLSAALYPISDRMLSGVASQP